MTKPLSVFLKSPAQNDEVEAESAAPFVRPVESEPVPRSEPERVVAPVETAVPVHAPQATALFEGSPDLISPVVEPALLAVEPMMTAPLAMRSVPVESVLVKPAVRQAGAARRPAANVAETAVAAEEITGIQPGTVAAAKKLVATAKITANKPLSGLFKPAINVKPSLFIKQNVPAESETVTAAEAENIAEQTVQAAFEAADVAETVTGQTVAIQEEQVSVAAVAETAQTVIETDELPVAATAAAEPENALSVSERAAEKLAVAAAAYAAGQEAAASSRSKIALPKIAVPKISMPKVSVLKVSRSQATAFKTAVNPIRAAISAISGAPAMVAVGRFWQNKPVRWSILGVLLPVSGVVAAYAVTDPQPQPELYRTERVTEELPAVYVESGTFQGSYWAQEAVEPGDSLTDVLQRMGVSDGEIREVLARNSVDRSMIQLRAGQSVNVRFDASGDITDVQFFNDDDNGFRDLVALEKVNGKWRASTSAVEMETMPTLRAVQVRTSARGALAQAGVPVEVRESLNEIFHDIVNVDELANGDSIRLLYNSMYFRGQEMATGDILAAEVAKGGKTYQAYYYSQGKGDEESGSYYDQHGKSLRLHEGFNVKPVDYMRISSPYGVRVHPVLHTVKMHTGIDYAAPIGTPIRATADGVLTFKGWQGGYGNTVILQHSNGIETLYAHMSAFSSAGGRVKAGEIIGYVGSTGRSTGPHLHYEVRKNGQHMNPTAIALPTPKLTPANMAEFRSQQRAHTATMAAVRNLPVTVTQLD